MDPDSNDLKKIKKYPHSIKLCLHLSLNSCGKRVTSMIASLKELVTRMLYIK